MTQRTEHADDIMFQTFCRSSKGVLSKILQTLESDDDGSIEKIQAHLTGGATLELRIRFPTEVVAVLVGPDNEELAVIGGVLLEDMENISTPRDDAPRPVWN